MTVESSAPKFLLGSGSPRRRKILQRLGYRFRVEAAEVTEITKSRSATQLVLENAGMKAQALAEKYPRETILSADTVVALEDQQLNKPRDHEEALQMLLGLSGKQHQVHSAIVLRSPLLPAGMREMVATGAVRFLPFDRQTAIRYLALIDPLDKAGAYAIQEHRALIIEGWRGSYFTIMGLPVRETIGLLQEAGIQRG